MKNVLKKMLKVTVAGVFVVVVGIGISNSLNVFRVNNNMNLLALSSANAQGEGGDDRGEGECWLCDFAPGWPQFPAWTVRIQCYSGQNLCIDSECLLGSCE